MKYVYMHCYFPQVLVMLTRYTQHTTNINLVITYIIFVVVICTLFVF